MADARYAEEQASELEILQSIYPTELTQHSATEFSISIAIDEEDVLPCTLDLAIAYTPEYPDELPGFSISVAEDEDAPEPGETDAVLDAADVATLGAAVRATGEESRGIAMVFSMAAALKEAAGQLLIDKTDDLKRKREARLQREIAAEQAKFVGTPVTRESFLAWKAAFDAEMSAPAATGADAADPKAPRRAIARPDDRPTGRRLFEQDRSLAKSDSKFLADGDVSVDTSRRDRERDAADDDGSGDDDDDDQ
ncbi:rwd domain-containing protein [Coemansia nantahalensis]|uniref:Rwd domain-containing protein n=1 Tax=Coemansia nantahalensis TaxID=2789366 RepID=A0ACC1K8P1_9FUNG|nr:rwd domain-containing protein [Coemansia nantahalensis]KAJ2775851.1 rwd domain-containing protein [Coemansia nantahalensis]